MLFCLASAKGAMLCKRFVEGLWNRHHTSRQPDDDQDNAGSTYVLEKVEGTIILEMKNLPQSKQICRRDNERLLVMNLYIAPRKA